MTDTFRLVGFSGYARSGKDTAYSLIEPAGWNRVAFADIMRTFMELLDPIVATSGRVGHNIRVSHVIEQYGWDGYKSSVHSGELRSLLQRLGTECGRGLLGDNIWVDSALNGLGEGQFAVTDCRFLNEAEAIRQRGGKIIRINRPGVGPANEHISETGLDSYDFDEVIDNDGTLEEFKEKLLKAVA